MTTPTSEDRISPGPEPSADASASPGPAARHGDDASDPRYSALIDRLRRQLLRLAEANDGELAEVLGRGADAVAIGVGLTTDAVEETDGPELSGHADDARHEDGKTAREECGSTAELARSLVPVAERWARQAVARQHARRAALLLLEAAVREVAASAAGGAMPWPLWEEAFDAALATRSLPEARLACDHLMPVILAEGRHDFAAYLAGRLAQIAQACGDLLEASNALLDASRYWDRADRVDVAFDAAVSGLEAACASTDRPRVTRGLLALARLGRRGESAALADEAFKGALGALSQGAESSAILAHARFGLATMAARSRRWQAVVDHLEAARLHAHEAGQLPLYARAVIAAIDIRLKLGQPTADYLAIARRDATAFWGLGAASLFKGLCRRASQRDASDN